MKSSFFFVAMLCFFTTDLYATDLDALIRYYANKAEKENAVFSNFDVERGKNLYSRSFISGKKRYPILHNLPLYRSHSNRRNSRWESNRADGNFDKS